MDILNNSSTAAQKNVIISNSALAIKTISSLTIDECVTIAENPLKVKKLLSHLINFLLLVNEYFRKTERKRMRFPNSRKKFYLSLEKSSYFNMPSKNLAKRIIDNKISIIAEHKRKSPSKVKLIFFKTEDVALGYEKNGAVGIST